MELNEPSPKRRVAIYIRVSTAEQRIDGYSFDAQRKKLIDYVENNKALNLETKTSWIYEDVHTGSDLNRKGYEKLMEDVIQKKFDAVLVWKIDRLSRNLKHLLIAFETLEKNQVSFISVQENIDFSGPIGRLIYQIFGAIAQFERELIKGRTLMGKIASAELGNYTGNIIPYGYKAVKNPSGKGKKLMLIPEEKKWVEQIFAWYIWDGLGERQITKKLNELKVPRGAYSKSEKTTGFKWSEKMVHTILTNTTYHGDFVANRRDENGHILPAEKWVVVDIPSCVSELTFQQAQSIRSKRTGGHAETDYLLSGKLRDMSLKKSKAFSGAPRYKGGFSYRRHQFTDSDGAHVPVFEIPGKQLEEYVWGKIMEAMKSPEVFISHYLSKEYAEPKRIETIQNQLWHLRAEEKNIQLAIERIQEAYERGKYSDETMSSRIAQKDAELADIQAEIEKNEQVISFMGSVDVEVTKLREASEQVKFRLEKLDRKQKKTLCDLFVDRIEMYRQREGKRWKVNAEIFFRFNPQKFELPEYEGRTEKPLAEGQYRSLGKKNDDNGVTGWT